MVLAFLLYRGLTSSGDTTGGDQLSLARLNFSQVWTGDDLLVFGGWGNTEGEARVVFGDGAAFDPDTNEWRTLAASPLEPRWGHEVLWTGDEMFVLGGVGVTDGAAYAPASDSWRPVDEPTPFVSTGWETASTTRDSDLIVWVRREGNVWRFDANAEAWSSLPRTEILVDDGLLLATDDHLVALGVPFPDEPQVLRSATLADGAQRWQELPEVDLAANGQLDMGELAAVVVDDGSSILLWGSAGTGNAYLLDVGDAAWADAEGPALVDCDGSPPPAIAGDQVVARSYCDGAVLRDPATGQWSTVALANDADPAPVWTGAELVGLGHDGEIYRWQP